MAKRTAKMTQAKLARIETGGSGLTGFEKALSGPRRMAIIAAPTGLGALNRLEGFRAGDRALAAFAAALRRSAPKGAAVRHLGGAKFGVAIEAPDEDAAMELMGGLFDDLARRALSLGAPHLGAAWSEAPRGADALISGAQSALDSVRGAGAHGVELLVLDEASDADDLALAREALKAIRAGRVRAAFQPVVDAETPGRVLFREALIRLVRPNGDQIPAGRFMPALSRLGLAGEADVAVLRLALEALEADPTSRVSVNLSPQSFDCRIWRRTLMEVAAERPEVVERLIVEVSEDSSLNETAALSDLLFYLRSVGVTVALDDFGAGRTSFAHLRDLRFDMVKIDGGFVTGIDTSPENKVMVAALCNIAQTFDMMVVAEFVETAQEARELRRLGVDGFQGFLFGRPTLVWSEGERIAEIS